VPLDHALSLFGLAPEVDAIPLTKSPPKRLVRESGPPLTVKKRGPRPHKRKAAVQALRDRKCSAEDLETMTEKELIEACGGGISRETARHAREVRLSELKHRQTPT
jgi:hypothetical protein